MLSDSDTLIKSSSTKNDDVDTSSQFSPQYREARKAIGKTVAGAISGDIRRGGYVTLFFTDGSLLQIGAAERITAASRSFDSAPQRREEG